VGNGHSPVAYRPDIDGLRAIAVLAVVLFHAQVPFLSGGFVGVDVFFVISGYLITAILLRDTSIVRFYQRRARRILPALYALIVLVLLAGLAILLPHDLTALGKSAAATLVFGSNVWFWRQAGYFAIETELWPLLHTWSLGVEEQFYIAFPVVVRLAHRLPRRWLAALFTALAVVSLASAVILMGHLKPVMAFYLAPMRAWELLVGSILATGVVPRPATRAGRTLAAAAGLVAVLGAIVLYSPATPFPGWSALLPVLGTALVIWAGMDARHGLTPLLGSAPMRGIGLISYSLYLWHWPVLAFARYVSVDPLSSWDIAAAVALAFGLAVLSWRFVERPFRAGLSDRAIWWLSGGGLALLIGASLALVASRGLPERFPARVTALNAEEGEDWRCPVLSMVSFGGFYACPLNLPSKRPADASVVLWGDSHAQMYAPGLLRALGERGGLLVNANGCAPVVGDAADASCGAIQRGNFARIAALPADTVILAQNWPQYRDEAGARLGRPPTAAERYGDGVRRLRALVAALRDRGKRVVIVGPVALPGYNLASVAARDLAFRGDIRTPTAMSRAVYRAEYANVLSAMDDLARTDGVTLVRPDSLICDARACPFIIDGRAVFADHGHFTARSAARLAPLFARAMTPEAQP
jgi:peptidoglycan/LPS O-acetylase OafA/YrhL